MGGAQGTPHVIHPKIAGEKERVTEKGEQENQKKKKERRKQLSCFEIRVQYYIYTCSSCRGGIASMSSMEESFAR